MFTTCSKFFLGATVIAVVAFVVYGIDSEWELYGCMVIASVAVVTAFLGGATLAFRDANLGARDVEALSAADAEGHPLVPASGVPPSLWPIVAVYGAAFTAIGLVLD